VLQFLVTSNLVPITLILFALMMEAILSSKTSVPEPHSVTSQKTTFFIATAVNTSNLT
jgi:hypothetical protein